MLAAPPFAAPLGAAPPLGAAAGAGAPAAVGARSAGVASGALPGPGGPPAARVRTGVACERELALDAIVVLTY